MVHACSVFPQLCLQSLCLKGLNFEGNSLSSWRPVKSARITLNKPQGREEAHGIRWSMHFFIPEHMVVACKLGNNLFFQHPDAVLHSGWLPRTFPLPRAAPPHSWIKRMLAEMSIKASFSHLKIEWKEGDDPESGQKQLPRRGRKIHQCSVKNYVSGCAEFCGKLLNPSFSEKKRPKIFVLNKSWGNYFYGPAQHLFSVTKCGMSTTPATEHYWVLLPSWLPGPHATQQLFCQNFCIWYVPLLNLKKKKNPSLPSFWKVPLLYSSLHKFSRQVSVKLITT